MNQNGYEPLKRTFIADPPQDESVALINILVRQIEVSTKNKKDVLDACKFVVARYDKPSPEKEQQ